MSDVKMKWYEAEVTEELMDVAAIGLKDAMEDMEKLAKNRCPVDTGWLRANIIHQEVERNDEEVVMALGVDEVVAYARVQEDRRHFVESSAQDLAPLVPDYIDRAAKKRR